MKAEAVAAAKEHGIGKSTVERAIAKAEGRKPKPKQKTKAQKWRDENPDYPTYEQVCAAADAEKEGSDPDAVRKLFGDSPNIGCNFDPEDPRGADEDEGVQIVRRRAWLYMADEAKRNAASFLAEHGHRAIAQADATEIDAEVIKAVSAANDAWEAVMGKLIDVVGDQVAGRALIESEDAAA